MKDLSTRFARLSIGLSFYSFALVGLSVGVGGVILKSLSTSYHVGDATLGTLFVVLYLSYSLSSFFCGPLAQRFQKVDGKGMKRFAAAKDPNLSKPKPCAGPAAKPIGLPSPSPQIRRSRGM